MLAHPVESGPVAMEVIDPVCGMKVDLAKAPRHAEHAGTTYYFCSAGCREKFVRDPESYLHKTAARRLRGIGGIGGTRGDIGSRRTGLRRAPSTPAPCTPRSSATGRGAARSAAWRSNPRR